MTWGPNFDRFEDCSIDGRVLETASCNHMKNVQVDLSLVPKVLG